MADPSVGRRHLQHLTHQRDQPTVATSSSVLTPGPASNFLSRTDASAMIQLSMELRELEAVSTLSTLSHVTETQLDTQAIVHELSVDSEVTFRKVMGSAEILPTRPGIDPFEETRPMDTSSDTSSLQLTPITSTSPSVSLRLVGQLGWLPHTTPSTSKLYTWLQNTPQMSS